MFWSISDLDYPDLVKHLHQQVRLVLPFDQLTNTLITRFFSCALGKICKVRSSLLRELLVGGLGIFADRDQRSIFWGFNFEDGFYGYWSQLQVVK